MSDKTKNGVHLLLIESPVVKKVKPKKKQLIS
jgi:hypothetical protein